MPEIEESAADRSLSFFRRTEKEKLQPAPGLTPGKIVGDFRLRALIGQGGMGQVWEAEQVSLQRTVAVKFVRPERVTAHQLELFAREARAGGRLSHPGIVSIFNHGTSDGLAWIAMEFVGGAWTLKDFVDEAARLPEVPEGYDRHVARLVAEIADAMQAAHEAGVIHRDLKPQNVLITTDDRPKVSDFGLARLTDEAALSQTGDFAGTYLYMSPEQAMAKRMGLDHRTDVFSLGVVLYELLALRRPFEGDTSQQVAEQIMYRDPPDPRTIRSKIPRDLAVIAGKALEKERDKRYPTMKEFAADLRRHLADEPIHATPPTRVDRTLKWIKRNPGKSSAAAIASAALAAITVLLLANVRANRALTRANTDLSSERTNLANANTALEAQTAESEVRRRDAESKRDEVLKLSALQDLDDLLARAGALWPAHPENIARYEQWIGAARALVAELPLHERRRAELRAQALPQTPEERAAERRSHPMAARLLELEGELQRALDVAASATGDQAVEKADQELARLEQERDELEAEVNERRDWRFPESEPQARWWNSQLTKLIDGLEELERGLLAEDSISAEHGWSLPKRLAFARTIAERSIAGPEVRSLWAEALASIRDERDCPAYGGLVLTPQLGLVPMGLDPDSGLWEFAHLQSGEPAARGADGKLVLSEETGIVLVLIPGGTYQMGAQRSDPKGSNYDPQAGDGESPVHAVTLTPFFLSKYEMTQGQWERFAGENPSAYDPDRYSTSWNADGKGWSGLHPVEQVSWEMCVETLARLGLVLPTEAQWEYGCRSGTSSVYWCGDEKESLQGVANLSDAYGKSHGNEAWPLWEPWLDDGQSLHAEVGSYRANAFGLHDVHGNVWEWCQDGHQYQYYSKDAGTDPVSPPGGARARLIRGGSYVFEAAYARSANRHAASPEARDDGTGLRVASRVSP